MLWNYLCKDKFGLNHIKLLPSMVFKFLKARAPIIMNMLHTIWSEVEKDLERGTHQFGPRTSHRLNPAMY